ncbi:MAG: prolyl oligopeptidase family serine peptidase [Planctomycetaceae bacterium]
MNRLIAYSLAALSCLATANAQEKLTTAVGQQVEATLATNDGGSISYLIYLPKDYDPSAAKLPFVLFLHGRGESNGPLSLVAKWGPPMMAAEGKQFPFILVSPQCPRDDAWSSEVQQKRLVELLDHIGSNYHVDQNRVYLTGLSMGGYGSWRLAADHPSRFAAVVPVCGGGKPEDADALKALPIWVFHGDQDSAVPFSKSVEMVDAIRAAGGTKIRFTTMEHIGHNCWSATYATPELYSWLLSHKRE